jgi:hypothetical protein
MTDKRPKRLTKEEVKALLKRLEEQPSRPECRSCECLRGFIAQLAFDADEDAQPLLSQYRKTVGPMQACSGCEPCPPARLFAEYLLRRREREA